MITRPLDLSTRLRAAPKNFDYLFWVNGVIIVLFFLFFGSRFVLSPGIAIGRSDEVLPVHPGALAGAVPTQLTLNVTQGGQLYVDTGFVSFEQFRRWLAIEARKNPGATILLHYNVANSAELMTRIVGAANEAGLRVQLSAVERPSDSLSP